MNNIEFRVTSLELSQRLAKWCKKESLFYWCNPYFRKCSSSEYRVCFERGSEKDIPAYLLSEVLEILPRSIKRKGIDFWLQVETENILEGSGWACQYKNNREALKYVEHKNPVEAAGELADWLHEQGYLPERK